MGMNKPTMGSTMGNTMGNTTGSTMGGGMSSGMGMGMNKPMGSMSTGMTGMSGGEANLLLLTKSVTLST